MILECRQAFFIKQVYDCLLIILTNGIHQFCVRIVFHWDTRDSIAPHIKAWIYNRAIHSCKF